MRFAGTGLAAFALMAVLMTPGRAKAQAVGFAPGVGSVPDGVSLGVTPSVSADRRYVRLGVAPGFQTVNGFQNFPVPAAVGGGGFRSVMAGGPINPLDLGIWSPDDHAVKSTPTKASVKAAKARAARAKKPLPDPVVLPIRKKDAGPRG